MNDRTRALVLLGHGSRAPGASESMELVASLLRERRSERVEVAHMELAEPSLVDVLAQLHREGVRSVSVVPYFLHRGVHLREDIPGILRDALVHLEGMELSIAPHLGFDTAIVDLVERRVDQAVPFEVA